MSLVDQYGRPLAPAPRRSDAIRPEDLRREIAGPSSWRRVMSDHPSRNMTPRRLVALLDAAEHGDATGYLDLAEDLEEQLPQYQSVLPVRKWAVEQLDWIIEAASDAAEDQRVADAVRLMIKAPGVRQAAFDMLDALGKGYSVSEVLWDQSAKLWSPSEIVWRHPAWFRWSEDGGAVRLIDGGDLVDLPPGKFIVHVSRSKSGLPIRAGLARSVGLIYLIWLAALTDFASFAETYGQPLRLGSYPAGTSREDRQLLWDAVDRLGSDAAAVIADGMKIQFIEAQRTDGAVYASLLAVLDAYISTVVLGQTLTTNVGASGSRALGDVHNMVRGDIRRADAQALTATLQKQLITPFVAINFGDVALPQLRIGLPHDMPATERVQAVRDLVPLGLRVGESAVRDMLGFEDPGDDAVLAPAQPIAPAMAAQRAWASVRPPDRPSDPIDRAVDDLLAGDGWRPLIEPSVTALTEAVARAGSYDEAMAAILALAAREPNGALAEAMARAGFAARLLAATG